MTALSLTIEEKKLLLSLARQSIQRAICGDPDLEVALENCSPLLQAPGASFVTLTRLDELRGCIGTLEAYQPLVQDVCEHAAAAATQDYRFHPVRQDEMPLLHIEISRLTAPVELVYQDPEELLLKIRPCVDGVVLRDGSFRATFLPQVWDKLPDPQVFMEHLSMKMGSPPDLWRRKKLKVFTYQVEEFQEE